MSSQQVKLPPEIKREVEVFATITGRTQSELLAASWREYRERHSSEFREGLRWAESVLADPAEAAVHASGMSQERLRDLDEAFTGDGGINHEAEPGRKRSTAKETPAPS